MEENELFLLKLKNEILLLEKMIKYNKFYNFKRIFIKKCKIMKINFILEFCGNSEKIKNYLVQLNLVEEIDKIDTNKLRKKIEIKKENYLRLGGIDNDKW